MYKCHRRKRFLFLVFIMAIIIIFVLNLMPSPHRAQSQRTPPASCSVNFADAGRFPLVALLSAPGSGNTWTRHLIQQATGFYTGSAYNVIDLAETGYAGETVDPSAGTTLTMKTHMAYFRITPDRIEKNVTAAIILIRNPFDMTISERNRRFTKSQTGLASWNKDLRNDTEWIKYAKFQAIKYVRIPISWMQSGLPFLVVHYENIMTDRIREIRRIAKFLNVTEFVTEERLRCIQDEGEGNYHRKYVDKKKMYDAFTDDLKTTFIGYIKALSEYLPESQPLPWEHYFNPLLGSLPNISSIEPIYDKLLKLPKKLQ